jgi:hypothetical protein
MAQPNNVQEVCQFIGLTNYYRQFIKVFATISAPLTDLKKGTGTGPGPITWDKNCEDAFSTLKNF